MVRPLGLPFDPIERAAGTWEERFGSAAAMRAATSVFRVQQILLARFDELLVPLTSSRTGEPPPEVIHDSPASCAGCAWVSATWPAWMPDRPAADTPVRTVG